jgi:hypothetical protein
MRTRRVNRCQALASLLAQRRPSLDAPADPSRRVGAGLPARVSLPARVRLAAAEEDRDRPFASPLPSYGAGCWVSSRHSVLRASQRWLTLVRSDHEPKGGAFAVGRRRGRRSCPRSRQPNAGPGRGPAKSRSRTALLKWQADPLSSRVLDACVGRTSAAVRASRRPR